MSLPYRTSVSSRWEQEAFDYCPLDEDKKYVIVL